MTVDYIIVGKGIAGAVMAYTLWMHNSHVVVVEDIAVPAASDVAAGIVNPVTGKKLSKTWQAEALFTFLPSFYRQMELVFGHTFFHPMPVYRLFTSVTEQNTWMARTALPEFSRFVKPSVRLYKDELMQPYGGMEILEAGYVDIPSLLNACTSWLQTNKMYQQATFDFNDLLVENGSVTWKGIRARKIIFCDGAYSGQNPYFSWLPFRPVKGELLTVKITATLRHIINQHLFIMPTQEEHIYRVGATYEWKDLSWEPTETAFYELTERLGTILQVPFEVAAHKAGIRPATADRRPFIGLHPEIPEVGIFNGLGTKGVSLAPYFANQFADYLLYNKELDFEVHIQRYISLYYLSK